MPAGPEVLADTGALLALLDERDQWHERCRTVAATVRLPMVTTDAVLCELFHLGGTTASGLKAVLRLVRSRSLRILPLETDDYPHLEGLMLKYADRPMDFADATLVRLAERLSLSTVFTLDNDDFETYRIGGRKAFRILPGRARP